MQENRNLMANAIQFVNGHTAIALTTLSLQPSMKIKKTCRHLFTQSLQFPINARSLPAKMMPIQIVDLIILES